MIILVLLSLCPIPVKEHLNMQTNSEAFVICCCFSTAVTTRVASPPVRCGILWRLTVGQASDQIPQSQVWKEPSWGHELDQPGPLHKHHSSLVCFFFLIRTFFVFFYLQYGFFAVRWAYMWRRMSRTDERVKAVRGRVLGGLYSSFWNCLFNE